MHTHHGHQPLRGENLKCYQPFVSYIVGTCPWAVLGGFMTSLLIQHADYIVSMDDNDTQWIDAGIYIMDNVIQQIGPTDRLPQEADRILNASNMLILPGLVN